MNGDPHYCDSKPVDPSIVIVNIIASSIGAAINLGLNLSPTPLFYAVFKKKRLYTDIPEFYIFSNIISATLNLSYGNQLKDLMMRISSGIGSIFSVFWGMLYVIFLTKGEWKLLLFYWFSVINIAAEIFFIFGFVIPNTEENSCLGNHIAGGTAMALTVINAITPGQNIYKVVKDGNYNLIPILITTFIFLCNGCWFIYGLFINQLEIYVPNGLGVILTAVQIVVFLVYYTKNKGKVFPNEEQDINNSRPSTESQQALIKFGSSIKL